MSFRRFPFQVGDTSPFERFNTRSQEDRNMFYDTTPIRRSYWNDMDTNTSHFEEPTWGNPPRFRNSGSAPGSPQTGHRTSSNPLWSGGSIPIKVVHEKSSKKETVENSNVQNNSSQGNGSSTKSEPCREPRVHHIPIMVEPRGDSNSSHASNENDEQSKINHPNSSTENMHNFVGSKYHQGNVFSTKTHLNNDGIKSTGDNTSENLNHQPRVCRIPIMVEPRTEQTFHSPDKTTPKKSSPFQGFPPRSNSASQPFEGPAFSTRKTESAPHLSEQKTPKKTPGKPTTGPHVSKVPINVSEPTQVKVNQSNPAEYALNQIARVKNEMVELKKQVEEFSGSFQDKQYRYLDEMLTQCMLKLDNIDTGGLDEIRKARKVAINEVQTYISLLESKINRKSAKSDDKNSQTSQEVMDVSKQSEEVSTKASYNIPSEQMEVNESMKKIIDNTQHTVPCTVEKIESTRALNEKEIEKSKIPLEEKMELSEVNNKKIKVDDNKSDVTKTIEDVQRKSDIQKMEVEAAETHLEHAMEIENTSIKDCQPLAEKAKLQMDEQAISDESKKDL